MKHFLRRALWLLLSPAIAFAVECGGANPCESQPGVVTPPPGNATGKFVDCSLAASGNGSLATPWNRTANITGMAISEDLWFKAGTTCANQSLTMNWSGTPADHVVVGSYYVSSGQALQLTPDNPLVHPFFTPYVYSHGTRAIIRGTWHASCSPSLGGSGGCPFGTGAVNPPSGGVAVPSNIFAALINMQCSFCDLQNIVSADSSGRGLNVRGPNGGEASAFSSSDHRIINVDVGPAAHDGFVMQYSHNDYVSGLTVHENGVAGVHGDNTIGNRSGANVLGAFNADVLNNSLYSNINTLIEKSSFINSYGEGFIVSQSGHVIMRGDVFSGSGAAGGLYTQTCGICVYEYNFIFGGQPGNSADHLKSTQYGIGIVAESAYGVHPETDIIIRGNRISFSSACIRVAPEQGSINAGWKGSIRAYNNTCVDMDGAGGAPDLASGSVLTAANVGVNGISYINNIFHNESGFTAVCNLDSVGAQLHHNSWWNSPAAVCRSPGTGDLLGLNPVLVGSGFGTKTYWTAPPTIADFGLQAASPALGAGISLSATTILNASEFPIISNITYPHATFDVKGWSIDALGRAADPVPDLGAQGR